MKKISYLILLTSLYLCTFARAKVISVNQSKKDIISNGFFMNFGLGNAYILSKNVYSRLSNTNKSYETGLIASIEPGNQWYFHSTETFGFGLQASYIQLGIGSGTSNHGGTELKLEEIRFGKVAAQFSKKLTKKSVIDLSLQLSPLCLFLVPHKNNIVNDTPYDFQFTGYNIGAGLRYRYRIFAFGTDINIGNSFDGYFIAIYPRIYTGFKF